MFANNRLRPAPQGSPVSRGLEAVKGGARIPAERTRIFGPGALERREVLSATQPYALMYNYNDLGGTVQAVSSATDGLSASQL